MDYLKKLSDWKLKKKLEEALKDLDNTSQRLQFITKQYEDVLAAVTAIKEEIERRKMQR